MMSPFYSAGEKIFVEEEARARTRAEVDLVRELVVRPVGYFVSVRPALMVCWRWCQAVSAGTDGSQLRGS